MDALGRFNPTMRTITTLDMLARVGNAFRSVESSPKWSEIRKKWPEAREGEPIQTGQELISRADFLMSLHEHALLRALQDLLTATLLLPGFAQAWRRAGDALGELRQFHSAVEYYEVATRLDNSLVDSLLPAIERMKVKRTPHQYSKNHYPHSKNTLLILKATHTHHQYSNSTLTILKNTATILK